MVNRKLFRRKALHRTKQQGESYLSCLFFFCLTQVLLKEDEKWVADYQHVIVVEVGGEVLLVQGKEERDRAAGGGGKSSAKKKYAFIPDNYHTLEEGRWWLWLWR
nr:hypothetical protein CFP56_59294 [Quercus suber]